MSQKTNPLSLRLEKTNQNFTSPWFTDFFFTENLKHELEVRKAIDSFLEETGHHNAFFSAKSSYRKFNVFLAIQDTRVMRKEKQILFRLKSSLSKRNRIAKKNKNVESSFIFSQANLSAHKKAPSTLNPFYQKKGVQSAGRLEESVNLSRFKKDVQKISSFKRDTEYDNQSLRRIMIDNLLKQKLSYNEISYFNTSTSVDSTSSNNFAYSSFFGEPPRSGGPKSMDISYLYRRIKDRPYLSYSEELLSKRFGSKGPIMDRASINRCFLDSVAVNVNPIRFIGLSQNVIPLIDLVRLLLEKRVPFRQIKEKVFNDLSRNKMIKGIRITCSGRFGGKSKKAQKAKMQSESWGQTSLSTFSSKLLFASKSANTSYGKIGIKIWIAFA